MCPLQGFYTSTGHPCGSTRVAAPAVPGWLCPGARSLRGCWRRQRPAWRQGGRLHCSRPAPLCAGAGARLPRCLAGLALRGAGTRAAQGTRDGVWCCRCRAAGARGPGVPPTAPTVSCARPSLPQNCFFFLSRKSLRLCSGRSRQGCATVLQCPGWVRAGLGDARAAPGRGHRRVQGVRAPCCPRCGRWGVQHPAGLRAGIWVLWDLCSWMCLSFPRLCSSQPAWARGESLLLGG